jgi:hypothetical protein
LYFYCESKSDSHYDYVVLDVNSLESLKKWWENNNIGFWNESDNRSMIVVKGLKTVNYRGFRAGKWYDLPDGIWGNFSYFPEEFPYDKLNRSLIFRLLITYKGNETLDFAQYKVVENQGDTYYENICTKDN